MPSAGSIRAGRAYVEIGAALGPLQQGLRRASQMLSSWGASISAMGQRIFGMGAAVTGGFAAASKVFASVGDNLQKMSLRTGVSVEALSELAFAASRSGANLEDVERAIRAMQKNLGTSSASTQKALTELGLSLEQLAGLAPEDQFTAIADAIARLPDATMRAAYAIQLFGRNGTALLPMLENGAAGLSQLRAEARRLGLTMTTDEANAAAALTDAMGSLWAVLRRLVVAVGAELAPMLTELANRVAAAIAPTVQFIRTHGEIIRLAFRLAAGVAAAGAGLFALGKTMTLAGGAAGLLAGGVGVIARMLPLILSPMGAITAAVTVLGVAGLHAFGGWQAILKPLRALFQQLATAANQGVAAILVGFGRARALLGDVTANVRNLLNTVITIAANTGRTIAGALSPVAGVIMRIVSELGHLAAVPVRLANLAVGFVRGVFQAFSEMVGLASGIVGAVRTAVGQSFGFLGRAANAVLLPVQAIAATVSGLLRIIGTALSPVQAVLGAVVTGLTSISNLASYLEQAFSNIFRIVSQAVNALAGAGRAVAGILASVRAIGTAISQLFTGIATFGQQTVSVTGAVVTYMTDAFQSVFQNLSAGWQWLSGIAIQAWQGIRDALAAGDMQLAAEVAMTGLQVVWLETVTWIKQKWVDLKVGLISIWHNTISGIAQLLLTGVAAMETIWTNLQQTFRRLWVQTVSFLGDTWDRLYYWLARSFTRLTHLFSSAAEQAAAMQAIDEEQARRAADRRARTQEELARIDREAAQRRQQIDQGLMDSLATLEEDRKRALADATKSQTAGLDEVRAKADQARKRFNELTQQAQAAREAVQAQKELQAPKIPTPPEIAKTVTERLPELQKLSSAGTFSALAARNLGMSGPLDRIAKATENTAENTRRMTRLLEENEAEFT